MKEELDIVKKKNNLYKPALCKILIALAGYDDMCNLTYLEGDEVHPRCRF